MRTGANRSAFPNRLRCSRTGRLFANGSAVRERVGCSQTSTVEEPAPPTADDVRIVSIEEENVIPKHKVTQEWVSQASKEIKSAITGHVDLERLQHHSDLLLECIIPRFDVHSTKNLKEFDNMVWKFCRANLSRVCTALVLSGLAKERLKPYKGNFKANLIPNPDGMDRLLLMDENCKFTDLKSECGVYLFYNPVDGCWIRSGKASTTFESRLRTHKNSSRLNSTTSSDEREFYKKYCSEEAEEKVKENALAYFEQLNAYCGLLIDRRNCDSIAAEEGGLFIFPKEVKISLSYHAAALRKEKRLEWVQYLFETVLELMMNPDDNVSTSPGFERYLLEKKKNSKKKLT